MLSSKDIEHSAVIAFFGSQVIHYLANRVQF